MPARPTTAAAPTAAAAPVADRLIAPVVAPAAGVLAVVIVFVCFAAYWA